ncbi:hypothetical protein [Chitinimonas lacunae]|uniref:Uncharacterized protein n=1 Tax=Chitinimonas lacunae TaxID=1963018 RepID=A0ABV8MKA5_9NEIS
MSQAQGAGVQRSISFGGDFDLPGNAQAVPGSMPGAMGRSSRWSRLFGLTWMSGWTFIARNMRFFLYRTIAVAMCLPIFFILGAIALLVCQFLFNQPLDIHEPSRWTEWLFCIGGLLASGYFARKVHHWVICVIGGFSDEDEWAAWHAND